MSFATWLNDKRWAANARRARKWRRGLTFSQRIKFDAALKPSLKGGAIAYPDAFYHFTIDDLARAMMSSKSGE